jgi:hypothetical protein
VFRVLAIRCEGDLDWSSQKDNRELSIYNEDGVWWASFRVEKDGLWKSSRVDVALKALGDVQTVFRWLDCGE